VTNMTAIDWPTLPLGTLLTDIQSGFASGEHNSIGEGVPHFRPMNVSTDGRIERTVLKYVDPASGRPELRLRRGDVIFNNTNSPELVGKTALFEDDDAPAFSNHMTRLRTDRDRLDPGYLALRLHQAWREGWFAEHCNNHVSQASIGRDVLRLFEIELPPLELQQAIYALYHRVDTSRASSSAHLAIARRAIERFRQAVLTVACSGQLTADWREEHRDAQSVKVALAALPNGPHRRSPDDDLSDLALPDFPGTYVLATVRRAATALEYGTSKRADADSITGIPVLRMGNIHDGRLGLDDLKFIEEDREIRRLVLADGDLLFNRTNSPELVGKSAVFHEHTLMTFASYLIRVQFASDVADPDFVNFWINSAWGKAWARQVKTDGVSQSNINGTKLGAMPVPLPPIEEQREIVRRTSRMLELADGLLAHIGMASRRVERSPQAILAKAFRGELSTARASNGT